jgi:hypothetical protein
VIAEPIQTRRFRENQPFGFLGFFQSAISDVYRQLHDDLDSNVTASVERNKTL